MNAIQVLENTFQINEMLRQNLAQEVCFSRYYYYYCYY
jgi:hypothetical protein